jgi:RND superfamily putative drug exporter
VFSALARRTHGVGTGAAGGWWYGVAQLVRRWPALVFAAVLAVLVGLGAPFLRVRLGAPDVTILPAHVESRQGFDLLRREFGAGEIAPNFVVVEADGPTLASERVGALYDYVRALERLPGVVRTESIVSLDAAIGKAQYQALYSRPEAIADPAVRAQLDLLAKGRVAVVSVVSRYNPVVDEARQLVRDIRATPPGPGLRAYVGGAAAELMDVVADLYTVFPRTLLVIVITTYLALLALFRSVVLPAKAVLMDTLSILASYGALVLIFQDGAFSGLLGFRSEGYVDATVPIVMFCVLFGLSMDYEVFMLSRIKEVHDRLGDNAAAVAEGLQRTGGVITSAALIIVIVAGSFAFAGIIVVKALGIGMALAILIDATVVRTLLAPATMHLLGRANWWAPRWLRERR